MKKIRLLSAALAAFASMGTQMNSHATSGVTNATNNNQTIKPLIISYNTEYLTSIKVDTHTEAERIKAAILLEHPDFIVSISPSFRKIRLRYPNSSLTTQKFSSDCWVVEVKKII